MDTVALEKGNFSTFTKRDVAYRASLIPGRLTDLSELELPDGSTLHTVNHFLELVHPEKDNVAPDFDFPLVRNERWQVYFKSFLSYANDKTKPIPMTDKLSYNGVRYQPLINKLYATNRHVHRMMAESALVGQKNLLMWFDYAALMQARISGTLAEYRKFDALFRTMLDHIALTGGDRHHYLAFQMSDIPYSQAFILPAFSALTTSTIKVHNDPSFFLLVHLLGYIRSFLHPVKAKPFALDVSYWKKNGIDAPDLTSTSLLSRIPDEVIPRINFVLYIGNRCIIYNLGDLKEMAQETQNMFQRVLKHINILKMSAGNDLEEARLLSMKDDDVEKEVTAKSPSPEVSPTTKESTVGSDTPAPDNSSGSLDAPDVPAYTDKPPKLTPTGNTTQNAPGEPKPVLRSFTPIKPVSVKKYEAKASTSAKIKETTNEGPKQSALVRHIHTGLQETLKKTETPHPEKIADKAQTLLEKHMAVELAGKPLGYYASHVEDPDISANRLTFLENQLPEKSQMDSSISSFDRTYLRDLHHRDLANTLTYFAKHGLFVSKIDETHTNTHLDKLTTYKITLSDLKGKHHTLPVTFPTVDKDGYMLVNGVKTRMIIQVVNTPICKISPTRVNLASNYNKTLVERHTSVRHTYNVWISTYLMTLRDNKLVDIQFGKFVPTTQVLPYEYTSIARKFFGVSFDKFKFTFDYNHRFSYLPKGTDQADALLIEESYGVYCGSTKAGDLLLWDMEDTIHVVDKNGKHILSYTSFASLLDTVFSEDGFPSPPMVAEWVTLKILDIDLPLVYILGYKFGLKQVLADLGANYRVVEKGERYTLEPDEIAIPFQDATLILNRYPFQAFLIVAGLTRFKTKNYQLLSFESEDIYYRVFQDNNIKVNYLRGIDDFFSFFLDPVTIDVLEKMNEPVTVKGLLYRATQMLSTTDYIEASASVHHRFRGYERFSSILYNEVSRQLAAYNNKRGQKKSFSINPEAVFRRIQGDPTDLLIDTINPIHELKEMAHVSYSGSGGRTGRAFVVNDRRFANDSVGILSEATPDSGKVAITAYTTVDPRIRNIRGMLHPYKDGTALSTPQLLSVSGNLFPAATQDDK